MAFKDEQLLIFDGGCGTTLQSMEIPPSNWDGIDGCNEYLNICSPETIANSITSFWRQEPRSLKPIPLVRLP